MRRRRPEEKRRGLIVVFDLLEGGGCGERGECGGGTSISMDVNHIETDATPNT